MGKKELWFVEGIDDLEGTIFAMCTTEEKAKNAKKKLEDDGFEDMLEIHRSNLAVDTIVLNNNVIEL